MERRSSARFQLELDVKYAIHEGRSVVARGKGRTLDVSSGGVLLTSDIARIPSGKIELSIAWPVPLEGRTNLQLHVMGNVLRQDGNVTAVQVDKYEFRTRAGAGR